MSRGKQILKKLRAFAWRSTASLVLAIASLTALVVDFEPQRACTAVEQAQVIKYRAEIDRVLMASPKSGVPYWKEMGGAKPPDCYPAREVPLTLASIPTQLQHASGESMEDLAWSVVVVGISLYGLLFLFLWPVVKGAGSLLAASYRRVKRGGADLQRTA
jgi:hypothetical protein